MSGMSGWMVGLIGLMVYTTMGSQSARLVDMLQW